MKYEIMKAQFQRKMRDKIIKTEDISITDVRLGCGDRVFLYDTDEAKAAVKIVHDKSYSYDLILYRLRNGVCHC